ncbi:hypothetical protein [Novosphingobium sp. BL-52-GroH]|uniref:hypothetical protein n=1 Tax=Novosphingobium sp. BL-52-GroH TaxID=3349877 RepID=UPI00384C2DA9
MVSAPATRRQRTITPARRPRPKLPRRDPREASIVTAREGIGALIETGDLDHDELTECWVEQWTADIYADRRQAA